MSDPTSPRGGADEGARPGADAAAPAGAAPSEPFLHQVMSLVAEIPLLLSDRVTLLALELRRAGLALAQILGLVVGAAVFAATAWLALWAGIAVALVKLDVGLGWVVLVVTGLNGAGAAWAVARVKALAPRLALDATLRQLTLPAREPRDAGPAPAVDPQAAARTAAAAVAAAARSSAAAGAPVESGSATDPGREDAHGHRP